MNRKLQKIEKLLNEIQELFHEIKEEKASMDKKSQTDCPVRDPLIAAAVKGYFILKKEEEKLSESSKELNAIEDLKSNNDILKDTVKQLKENTVSVGEIVIQKREDYRGAVERLSIDEQNLISKSWKEKYDNEKELEKVTVDILEVRITIEQC